MPTILRANPKDQMSVEYQRIQLTQYFMDWSLKYAKLAMNSYEEEKVVDEVESSITSIIHSALFIESFVNQMAEEFIDSDDTVNFDRCRKGFRNNSDLSNAAWKLYLILNKQEDGCITQADQLLISINKIVHARHKLVHYKPEEASRKIYRKAPNTKGMFTLDFMAPPIRIEPSLLEQEACCGKAIDHYMACRELSLLWCKLIEQDVGDFSRYPTLEMPNKSSKRDAEHPPIK